MCYRGHEYLKNAGILFNKSFGMFCDRQAIRQKKEMNYESERSQHDRESDPGHDERCHGDIIKKADPDGRIPKKSGGTGLAMPE